MKYYILIIFSLFKLNAQKKLNIDNVEINITNNSRVYNLLIEKQEGNLNDTIYLVKSTTYKFINKKKVINKNSRILNNKDFPKIQNILLNLDNSAFSKKSEICLDGISIFVVFSDNSLNNAIEQRFLCVDSKDEIFKSILKIYNFLPFKEKLL
ncbi:hypothetical protein [Empedobacter tilapiae]|uniref:Uncharacterized protein n=1 Tax=Empedobacter tilapiae TaxID=2491114 RepID=A0A4Z1BM57_9FLAO|nr:hypothetical protein [Empedobacter tilapiae]TGN26850.1 hypothetical protein E4J94_10470 [Empedobacter tilapiae]